MQITVNIGYSHESDPQGYLFLGGRGSHSAFRVHCVLIKTEMHQDVMKPLLFGATYFYQKEIPIPYYCKKKTPIKRITSNTFGGK